MFADGGEETLERVAHEGHGIIGLEKRHQLREQRGQFPEPQMRVIHVALEIGFMIDTPEAPGMGVMGFDRSPEGGSSAFWIMDEDELLLVRDDQ